MADHPTDITCSKIGVSKVDIVDMTHGPVEGYSGASMVPNDAFGSACGSRSVEDVQIVGAFHLLAGDVFELD